MFHPRQSAGNFGEVILACPLLCGGEGAVVCGNGVDLSVLHRLPQCFPIRALPDRGRADKFGRLQKIRVVIDLVLQQQVVGAGLHIDSLAPPAGGADLFQGLPGGEMDNNDRHVCQLGHPQKMAHCLCLQGCGPGAGMRPGTRLSRRFCIGDQGADDPVVFTVNPGDAAGFSQPQQGVVHISLRDHHGGVGHVHFERCDPLVHHFPDLPGNALVPVVNGHVKAVVAGAVSSGLFLPAGQTGGQGFPLVWGGKVDNRGGAPPQGGPGAGGKIIGGDGPAHLQIKVGVAVNKTGEEELSGTVNDPCIPGGEIFSHGGDPLSLQQHVQYRCAFRRDNRSSLQQNTHW